MKRIGSAAVAGLAVVFLTVPLVCDGSGGSNWHVTVTNPTSVKVYVEVGYGVSLSWVTATINPGAEATLNIPGAQCPKGVRGRYWVGDHWLDVKESSCLGHDVGQDLWTVCCWNVTFEVCRKAGTEGGEQRDDDFGFCKK